MIKKIETETIYCQTCGSYLNYEKEDIQKLRYRSSPDKNQKTILYEKSYIKCPICGAEIIMRIRPVDIELEVKSNWC